MGPLRTGHADMTEGEMLFWVILVWGFVGWLFGKNLHPGNKDRPKY